MAKEQKTDIRRRTRVDARDTFDFTTPNLQITARPTDPYARPGEADTSVADTLTAINQTVDTYVTAQEGLRRSNAEQAKADFVSGKKDAPFNPLNIGIGYNETWDVMDGEARAINVATDYHKILETSNYFVDAEDPAKARNDAWQSAYEKHFGQGHVTEYTKVGAYERLQEARRVGDLKAFEKQADLAKQAYAKNQSAIINDAIERANGDPVVFRQVVDNLWKSQKETGALTRDEYTNIVITAVQSHIDTVLNLDPKEMDFKAKRERALKLLDALKQPGDDGAVWSEIIDPTTGAPKFGARITSIVGATSSKLNEIKAQHVEVMENQLLEKLNGVAAAGWVAPEGKTRLDVAREIQQEVAANKDLFSSGFSSAILAKTEQIIDAGGFPLVSDAKTYRNLYDKAKLGSLSYQTLAANVNNLNEQQYDELMNIITAESRRTSPADREYNELRRVYRRNLIAAAGAQDDGLNIKGTAEAIRRANAAVTALYRWEEQLIAAGTRPGPAEWGQQVNLLIQSFKGGNMVEDPASAINEKLGGKPKKADEYWSKEGKNETRRVGSLSYTIIKE